MLKWLTKLFDIGISKYPPDHQVRVRLVNQLSLFFFIAPTIDFLRLISMDPIPDAAVFAPFASVLYASVPLVSLAKPSLFASRIYFIAIIHIIMIFIGSIEGKEFGSQYVLIAMAGLPIFLFGSLNKRTIVIALSALPIATIIAQEATNYQLLPIEQQFTAKGSNYILAVGSALIIIAVMKLFYNESLRYAAERQNLHIKSLELESINKAKNDFLAKMSHELRTPLNIIFGHVQIIQARLDKKSGEKLGESFDEIDSSGKHLLSLINSILDISKIESGKLEVCLEQIDPKKEINSLLSQIRPLAMKNKNSIRANIAPALRTITTDITKFRQIILNILANACKFTTRGTITVDVSFIEKDAADFIAIVISDTGIGMTADEVGRVFEPFIQADSSTTRRYGGSGLGLSIANKFVDLLKGELAVTSLPGHGSTFTIFLPAGGSSSATTSQHAA